MFAAAGETGDCTAQAADSRKLLTTIRTAIDESRRVSFRREGKIMTALLVCDSQIDTRLPPFGAVRQNSASPGAKLSQNMGEFMAQSAIDFGGMLEQQGI
jgi:hypothetical protein